MSNFHFGKCLQNTDKKHIEINGICMRFETLCVDKFEKATVKNGVYCEQFLLFLNAYKKRARNVVFVSKFHFGKCV